jgi:hypothetical protein
VATIVTTRNSDSLISGASKPLIRKHPKRAQRMRSALARNLS